MEVGKRLLHFFQCGIYLEINNCMFLLFVVVVLVVFFQPASQSDMSCVQPKHWLVHVGLQFAALWDFLPCHAEGKQKGKQ